MLWDYTACCGIIQPVVGLYSVLWDYTQRVVGLYSMFGGWVTDLSGQTIGDIFNSPKQPKNNDISYSVIHRKIIRF
jgi:hypothetical protein